MARTSAAAGPAALVTGPCGGNASAFNFGKGGGLVDHSGDIRLEARGAAGALCLVADGTDVDDLARGTLSMWGAGTFAVVSALPLICFGFQCHLTFSLVYDSLSRPTPARIDAVAYGCMFLCARCAHGSTY
jgi:hypothetical protein